MAAPLRWLAAPLFLLLRPVALADDPAPAPPAAEPQVLIPSEAPSGGWGGPFASVSSVNGSAAVFVGGRGAWITGRRLSIGGGFSGMVTVVEGPSSSGIRRDLQMSYGGLWLEWTFQPLRLAHATAGLLAGVGGASLHPREGELTVVDDDYFVLEPALLVELNVGSTVRADLGVTYRYVTGFALDTLDGGDLSSFGAVLVLKFGSF